mgnify:CR=1 FL=1
MTCPPETDSKLTLRMARKLINVCQKNDSEWIEYISAYIDLHKSSATNCANDHSKSAGLYMHQSVNMLDLALLDLGSGVRLGQ